MLMLLGSNSLHAFYTHSDSKLDVHFACSCRFQPNMLVDEGDR